VWERVLLTALGAASTIVGLAIKASRRNRLRSQVETYTELAATVEPHDAASAQRIRQLVRDTIDELLEAEHAALRRRFDTSNLIAILFVAVPSITAIIWAWPRDEWWRWLIILVAAFLVLVALIGGGSQLWKTREDAGR
jgi:type II secretory pathway component PulL